MWKLTCPCRAYVVAPDYDPMLWSFVVEHRNHVTENKPFELNIHRGAL